MSDRIVPGARAAVTAPALGPLTVFIPGILTNPNNRRTHWRVVHQYGKRWGSTTVAYMDSARNRARWFVAPEIPKRITLMAHVFNFFDDHDGIRDSLKWTVDALGPPKTTMRRKKTRWGYAMSPVQKPGSSFIHSDGRGCGHVFVYDQVVDRKHRGVEITIELLPVPAARAT